jgi:pimeloyl-ACP methyl ester carboxylesterase
MDMLGDGDSSGTRGEVTCLDIYNQARQFIREYLGVQLGYTKFYFVGMSVGGFITSLLLRDADDIMQDCLGVLLIAPAFDFPLYKMVLFSMEQMAEFYKEKKIDFKSNQD